jgi:hypothetical protein
MHLTFKRVRRPEWIVGVGGVVLLAAMLLFPWYTLTAGSPPPGPRYFISYSVDGWTGLTNAHWLLLVTIVIALALVFFQARERAPAVPVTLSLIAGVFGGLTAIWLIYRVLIDPPGGSRQFGGILGLLAALAITYGGWSSLRLEGTLPEDGPAEIPTVGLGEQLGT